MTNSNNTPSAPAPEAEAPLVKTERLAYFSSVGEGGRLAWFTDGGDSAEESGTIVGLDFAAYEDLGEPEVVTVSVVAGDHLNADEDTED